MKQTKIFSMMAAVLITAMSIGFTSCSKDSEPEDPLLYLWGWWVISTYDESGKPIYTWLGFKRDNTYTYEKTGNQTIDGMFRVTAIEKTTVNHLESEIKPDGNVIYVPRTLDAYLFKMLASGSSVFDQMWVYSFQVKCNVNGIDTEIGALNVQFYSGNEHLQEQKYYMRDPFKGSSY